MNIGDIADVTLTQFELGGIIFKNVPVSVTNYGDYYVGYVFGMKCLIDKKICTIK